MGLIKKASDKAATAAKGAAAAAGGTLKGASKQFEGEPDPGAAADAGATTAQEAKTETPAAASTSTAVAPVTNGAVAISEGGIKMMNVVAEHENKLRVQWNTLDRIQATNGAFVDKGRNNASLGAQIQLQLLSWQHSYQVSPGSDDEEAKALVRYSDDGIVTTKGENIQQYIEKLRELGYNKAALDHRVLIAGMLVGSEKDSPLEGELVQIDLSKTSREEFDKYKVGTAFKIGKGLLTADSALTMTMTAENASWKGKNWTVVKFSPTLLTA